MHSKMFRHLHIIAPMAGSHMAEKPELSPKSHLRVLPHSLGSFHRLSSRDCGRAAKLLGEGLRLGSGVILNAVDLEGNAEFLEAAEKYGLDLILDPMAVELSTAGGWG